MDEEHLSAEIRKLNTLRNDIAHEFGETEYGQKMWPFVPRLRRSTGRRRKRWLGLAKARFLRLTGDVFIQVIKAIKKTLDPDDLESARRQLPVEMRDLIDDPERFFQKLDELSSRLPPAFPDPSEITDISAARAAAVAISKAYEAAMVQLSTRRGDKQLSTEEWSETIAKANDLRVRGYELMQIVKRWSDAGFEEAVLNQYSELVPLVRWLQERAKHGAA